MRSISRYMSLVLTGAMLPLLLAVPSVAADPDTDQCVGDVDAGDSLTQPTPLEVFAGCEGKLHHADANSSFSSDWADAYSIRVEGSGMAKLDWRLCNLSDGYVLYEVWYYPDLLYARREAAYYVAPGECSSQEPITLEGYYKPGEWRLLVNTNEDLLKPGQTLNYNMYAQPLWR